MNEGARLGRAAQVDSSGTQSVDGPIVKGLATEDKSMVRFRIALLVLPGVAILAMTVVGCTVSYLENGDGTLDSDGDGEVDAGEDFFQGRDPGSFDPASPLGSFNLAGLRPTEPATFVQMRFGAFGDFEVYSSVGTKCSDADDVDACTNEFDGLAASSGFATGCLPSSCYHYLAINRENENFVVRDLMEMLSFFGSIDTPEEALLLAASSDYRWGKGDAVVHETEDGYEIVVTKLTGFCDPVEKTRFLLKVSSDGSIEVLNSEVISSELGVCI